LRNLINALRRLNSFAQVVHLSFRILLRPLGVGNLFIEFRNLSGKSAALASASFCASSASEAFFSESATIPMRSPAFISASSFAFSASRTYFSESANLLVKQAAFVSASFRAFSASEAFFGVYD